MDELNQLISEHVKELNYCVRLNVIYLGAKGSTRIGSLFWSCMYYELDLPKCRYEIERNFCSPKIPEDDYLTYIGVYNHYERLFSAVGVQRLLPSVPMLECLESETEGLESETEGLESETEGLESETEGLESETQWSPLYLPEVNSLYFRNVEVNIEVSTNDNDLCIKRWYYCGLKGKDSYRVYDGEFLLEQVLELIGSLNSVVARNSNTKSARNI